VLQRWPTTRFWRDDAPKLATARGAVGKFLSEQYELSSGTEPWGESNRANAYTYHFGNGRGVRWHDQPRRMLWLVGMKQQHDGGYAHCKELQGNDRLWPETDPAWEPGTQTLAAWKTHADEDIYEWARIIYGALTTWQINRAKLDRGDKVSYPCSAHLELERDDADIWTLTVRRHLAYVPPATQRQRWMLANEILALFRHLVLDPETDEFEIDDPPHPECFSYAWIHFTGGPVTPEKWLARVAEDGVRGRLPTLVGDAQHLVRT
jgi:hypothetical protein